jgi:Fe-S oxidoreductase, related to NifB/MoaA family
MVEIDGVEQGSAADIAGLRRGDYLISINGHEINDVLDYRYYLTEKQVALTVHRGPELFEVAIEKGEYGDIGLEFRTFLMDDKRSCRNKCVFCFIDQLPPGLRESLYFKDDDSRMSFIMGNYITLTNLSDEDINRIIKMRTSPLNISVHTTDPELRVRMMNNKNAGNIMESMRRFAAAKIKMNCQIVLCKGLNDGEALDNSMADLESLWPAVESVSIVPAGITKFREGLYPLEPFTSEECAAVINQVVKFAEHCRASHSSRIFFCADEFYIKAKLPIPRGRSYEGYPQLENGVGMIRSMKDEFDEALAGVEIYDLLRRRDITLATGEAAHGFITTLMLAISQKCPRLKYKVFRIKNDFFGENITVAGLITGIDLYKQLRGKNLGETLFLPSTMLRRERDMFLDSMTPEELEQRLNVKIVFIDNDGHDFVDKILS